jgi:hypothetical protein
MIEIHVDAPQDGIPAGTVEKLTDYSTRTSSRAAYV